MARLQAVTVEKARDHIVSRDQRQRADGVNDVGGGAGALPPSAARQSVLSVGASHPVQGQHSTFYLRWRISCSTRFAQ